ncbi:MAG TPA: tryptophan synthase subunit alpha [Spirochaetota bacterium]|nr:tryptophan synthase subunit alpha [Spirochaetota bacterium]
MKIEDKIKKIKENKKIGFMGHIIAGFPNIQTSYEAALGICEAGADFLEVQFPFSDPTADGATIEDACYVSLANGFKIESGFDIVKKLSTNTSTLIFIMTYSNIVFRYGVEKFVKKAKESGASGLIIPDLPLEEDESLNQICKENDMANIFVAAPGADAARIKKISRAGNGLLYAVARRGITGKKTDIDNEVENWLKLVRENSILPVATGFGIQTKSQVESLVNKTDIAVVGSFFVKTIKEAVEKKHNVKDRLFNATKEFIM